MLPVIAMAALAGAAASDSPESSDEDPIFVILGTTREAAIVFWRTSRSELLETADKLENMEMPERSWEAQSVSFVDPFDVQVVHDPTWLQDEVDVLDDLDASAFLKFRALILPDSYAFLELMGEAPVLYEIRKKDRIIQSIRVSVGGSTKRKGEPSQAWGVNRLSFEFIVKMQIDRNQHDSTWVSFDATDLRNIADGRYYETAL